MKKHCVVIENQPIWLTEEQVEEIASVAKGVFEYMKSVVGEFKKDPYYRGLLDGAEERHRMEGQR